MNAKKAKAIRKVILPKGWHPEMATYKTISHTKPGRYVMQFVCQGPRQEYKFAKKIYKITGVLPHAQ